MAPCRTSLTAAGRGRREARPGLTLIELLVVMAILMVLVALLMPAARSAIDEANLAECRGNLRNLGLCTRLYAKDHDGMLPVSDVLDGPHPGLLEALRPYGGEPRLYYCPSETQPDRLPSDANTKAGRIGYFYYCCRQATANRMVSTFLRWNVRWPRPLANTLDPRMWVASDAWFSGEPTAHRAWKKGVNYVTLGGDVQFITESPRQAFQ